MPFQIVGDDVYYEGERVATLCDMRETMREEVVDLIGNYAHKEHKVAEEMEKWRDEVSEELEKCEARRDALAAILRVEP